MSIRLAVLYQAVTPPMIDGVVKPPKPGGYSDSGADIAYTLRSRGIDVLTPIVDPDACTDQDWTWPDTSQGVHAAVSKGASVLWANTTLFSGHPVEQLRDIHLVGQPPSVAVRADDKFATNAMLRSAGLPVSASFTIAAPESRFVDSLLESLSDAYIRERGFAFPLVVKPVRGRGSQGVQLVEDVAALRTAVRYLFLATANETTAGPLFGYRHIVEEYLPGDEITITVMPPGRYKISEKNIQRKEYWALPPVRRFAHQNGIAPYSGVVAVTKNSKAVPRTEAKETKVKAAVIACETAAKLVAARAPIRIDCRASPHGGYKLFDLNTKPNMTGPGRPGREEQDSLVLLAARAIDWDYGDLLLNILQQTWKFTHELH